MLNLGFLAGLVIFALSSAYFCFIGRGKGNLNSAFLVSLVTLISYVLMWQGKIIVVTETGQSIFWTRWLFYLFSCTLLMVEIARLKGIQGRGMVQLLYLTAIVMFTGFLAARDLTAVKWIHFAISCAAYAVLLIRVVPAGPTTARWVNGYVFFGWTVFPIVFLLAPTGIGLIGSAIANLLYLPLDVYTKIVFYIQAARTPGETLPT
jgi:sensory rhodopsin